MSPMSSRACKFQSTLPVWGGTLHFEVSTAGGYLFQSTLPVWGGTSNWFLGFCATPHFNPPSPCGEGHKLVELGYLLITPFQSTLPVWGGTLFATPPLAGCEFQSTLPVWGGTATNIVATRPGCISIHPPRVGRDRRYLGYDRDHNSDFNPPSPCGEGPGRARTLIPSVNDFNPPSPCGEGPVLADVFTAWMPISIHPPRVGRDAGPAHCKYDCQKHFNPPSPCGEGHPAIYNSIL